MTTSIFGTNLAVFLVAQNYGTITNFTLDYTSPHNVIEAVWGETGNKTGDLGMSTVDRLMSSREARICSGNSCGTQWIRR